LEKHRPQTQYEMDNNTITEKFFLFFRPLESCYSY
jgi:hypothetical protein